MAVSIRPILCPVRPKCSSACVAEAQVCHKKCIARSPK